MKLIFSGVILIVALLAITSCKKGDTGPQGADGPAGPAGPMGPQGIAGNANAMQYTFGAFNYYGALSNQLKVPTTADTANRSAWFIYMVRAGGNVYSIPGWGVNGSTEYRTFWETGATAVDFTINTKQGPGEEYTSTRIIRIYATGTVNAGRNSSLPDIDFNDYAAVCRYYGLEQ